MSRLTEKKGDRYFTTKANRDSKDYVLVERAYIFNCVQKLGQLEDIEEELGIDLVTLFKALKNGVYVPKGGKRFIPIILCHEDLNLELEIGYQEYVSAKDYGKTWALTREELL